MSAYAKLIAGIVGVLAYWVAQYSQGSIQLDQEALVTLIIQGLMLLGIERLPNTSADPK